MASPLLLIKKINHFITNVLWKERLSHLNGRKGLLVRQIRVFSLAVKGFNEDKCLSKASALTYYTLFSIVPVLALLFAIAKGFGFQQKLEENIRTQFAQYQDVLGQAFTYANSMLANAKGGIIAGIGIVLLLWSVMKLLGSIEDNFNEIWEIKKGRSFTRKFTDYLSIMLIAPVFIMLSGSITLLLRTKLTSLIAGVSWLEAVGPGIGYLFKFSSLLLITLLFTFLYMVLPNTKVNFKSAFTAGIVAGILFELVEWAYISFQIGAASMNAIYGSFAALPLFLIWVQYSWFIVLFGAELAFAYQNVEHYELEGEIQNISHRYKNILALLIVNKVLKNFINRKPPMSARQIAEELDLPIRLARSIIFDFTESGIFVEVKTKEEKDVAYQPGISENQLSVKYLLNTLEKKGVNNIPIRNTHELEMINRVIDDFDSVLESNKGNILVKDII